MKFKVGDRVILKRIWWIRDNHNILVKTSPKGTVSYIAENRVERNCYYVNWDTPGSDLPYSGDDLEKFESPSEIFQNLLK